MQIECWFHCLVLVQNSNNLCGSTKKSLEFNPQSGISKSSQPGGLNQCCALMVRLPMAEKLTLPKTAAPPMGGSILSCLSGSELVMVSSF